MRKVFIPFITVIALFTFYYSAQSKPKNIDLAKELYFNPKLPYSLIVNDIGNAGYRAIEVDSLGSGQYTLYRDIFKLTPLRVYFTIKNDTIRNLSYMIENCGENPNKTNVTKFIKNLVTNYTIGSYINYDGETCGKDYSQRLEFYLRNEVIYVYLPIDYESTCLNITILPQDARGKAYEDLNNSSGKSVKKPSKTKK